MYPEEGRSAIAAAARAIADLRLGRVDEETTANVGIIQGGTARNIVPEWCSLDAEARSHDEQKLAQLVQEMVDAFAFAAGLEDCEVETKISKSYKGYRFTTDDPVVRIAHTALERSGYAPTYGLSGGAADANVFNERGLAVPQSRERDDGHPHLRRADHRRRPRGHGRGDARARRRRSRC